MTDGVGGRPGLHFRSGQVGRGLLEGSAHHLVRREKPFASGSELLDLGDGDVALLGQRREDLLAGGLGALDQGVALGLGLGPHGLGLLAGLVHEPLGFGLGRFLEAPGDRLRFLGPSSQDGLGLAAQHFRLLMRFLQYPGGIFLSPGFDVACCFVGALEDVGGLVPDGADERLFVKRRMGGAVLGVATGVFEGRLTFVQGDNLGGHLDEERPDLVRVESPAGGTKVLLRDEVRRQRPLHIHHGLSVRRAKREMRDPSGLPITGRRECCSGPG
ncbi:MAG: hypothetical protein QOE57_582 [Acidimicrobiaceae bacterium]|nr:hypothetical protein [Acidimicrobiaceae bacterium]